MQTYLYPLLNLLSEMAPYLLLGFLIAGILHAFVPRAVYARYLSRGDFRSVLLAAMFGVPLPLCSCGVIPTAMSMRREGASRAATVSFLIATPQTGVDSIAATASLMGLPFALLRPVAALVTALFGGGLVSLAVHETPQPAAAAAAASAEPRRSFLQRCREALRYGFVEMMQDIGRWLVIGLVVAGAITVLLPDNFFVRYADHSLLNMCLVLLLAVPMYTCATGSSPIAAALVLKGLSPGVAFVLLMAGPATNLAAILVIGKVLGRRTLLLYLASIITGAIGFGLLIDCVLPAAWFAGITTGHICCGLAEMPLWKHLAGALLLVLLCSALLKRRQTTEHKSTAMNEEHIYRVKGMSCNHCRANVERALSALEGVESVRVDLASGTAAVTGPVDPARVVATVCELGYECTE